MFDSNSGIPLTLPKMFIEMKVRFVTDMYLSSTYCSRKFCLQTTYHLGILGFYRGFILSMITFGPQSMLFWHIFGSARESLSRYHYIKERQNAHIGKFENLQQITITRYI